MSREITVEDARRVRDLSQLAIGQFQSGLKERGIVTMLELKRFIYDIYKGADEKPEKPVPDGQDKTAQQGPKGPALKA